MKVVTFFITTCIFFVLFQFSVAWQIGSTQIAPQEIVVDSGDTIAEVIKKLQVDNTGISMTLYRKYFAPGVILQAGTYNITETKPLSDVLLQDFKKPAHTDRILTFLPGWNLFDIEDYLTKKGIKNGDLLYLAPKTSLPKLVTKYSFLANLPNLEGVIYPDTYRVPQNASIDQVVDIALKNFNEKIYSKLSDSSKKHFYSTLILASIVEKEERNPLEKPYVAGVLKKRVDIKMSIGADATICYALSLGTSECTPVDIVRGLESSSPYNTRKFLGLPPSPISNLTRESWLASDTPKYNGALYYLHDSQGEIHYGKTLEEHNINKRKYLGR